MPNTTITDLQLQTDRDELINDIVNALVAVIRPALAESREPQLAGRQQMAELLGVGIATLDRMTSAGTIPSVLVQSRRMFEPRRVIDALSVNELKSQSGKSISCSVGDCNRQAELYEHDQGVFAYCPIHAVGRRVMDQEQLRERQADDET